jgi:glycosyltransferase involved in cell wall biosynthesis
VVMLGYNDPGRMRIIRWCEKNQIPCFLWGDSNIRGDLARGWKALFKKLVVSRIIRACAGLFPCGELGAQYFAKYGGDPKRMFYHPVEPDYDLITNLPQKRIDEVKRQYNLREGRRRIIFSGRVIEVKRPDLMIRAFIDIAPQRPEWDLIMVGEGVLRKGLQEQVPPQLRERVIWTGFIDDQPAVSALYRSSDLLVLPSDFEPWGLVVNEAATAGLALICADAVGAAKELVRDGVNGRVFPAGDLKALTAAILEVTRSETIDAMKAASIQVVQHWREVADPIDGLRRALRFCQVLPGANVQSN